MAKGDGTKPSERAAGFTQFFETRQKSGAGLVEERRLGEARAVQPLDGRISTTVDARGLVQFNVRVPVDVKNRVIEERNRRKVKGEDNADVSDIVTEALRLFLSSR